MLSENKHGGIWNQFGYRKSDKDQTAIICKVYRKTVGTKSRNTSNLFYYVKHRHKLKYEERPKMRETMKASTENGLKGKKIASVIANCVPFFYKQSK